MDKLFFGVSAIILGTISLLISFWNIKLKKVRIRFDWILFIQQPTYFFFWVSFILSGSLLFILIGLALIYEYKFEIDLLSTSSKFHEFVSIYSFVAVLMQIGYHSQILLEYLARLAINKIINSK